MRKHTEEEIIQALTEDGTKLSDYLVVLGGQGVSDILYVVHENVLFFNIIENDQMAFDCIEYIKKHGHVYKNDDALKRMRPDILYK